MNVILKNVLEGLRAGNLEPVYTSKAFINDVALRLYSKPTLDDNELEDLKDIITIANITYNDTDKEILPIEDGVYDLLLEKYKEYDSHFQVGAEVIDFKSSTQSGTFVPKQMKEAAFFDDPVNDKEFFFLDDIVVPGTRYLDRRDFENRPIPMEESYISKRTHDTSHQFPELVGTLNKVKMCTIKEAEERGVINDSNVRILERDFFMDHLNKGIISPNQRFDIVLELKYDGISVEAECTDEIISARSRGDTGIGKASDLTPFLKGYKFPHRSPGSEPIGVKFEAIITQNDLPYFNAAKGYEYKNCRSAIVGLLSSADAWKYRDFITLVPLAVETRIYQTVCHSDRVEEIEFLNREFVSKGCPLRYSVVTGNYLENIAWTSIFTQNAESLRYMVPFMYDGIVVSYRDEAIRQRLGRENFINLYSVAVKFNPLKKETIFRGYTYTVGQDGSITPMIHYDPVEFYGTIHPKSSGHSYARFMELGLHKGDIISVEYVNDVMPYVSKPINDFNLDNEKITPLEMFPTICPICGSPLEISESGKSVRCINPSCDGRQLSRMVNMCNKLQMDGFGEATIIRIGAYHLKDMMEMFAASNYEEILLQKGFGNGEIANMKAQIDNLITRPLSDSELLGAIGFTGLSTKTFELVMGKIQFQELAKGFGITMFDPEGITKRETITYLASIKGIGPITADTIGREFEFFYDDLNWMFNNANIIHYRPVSGKKIRFSGFRDKELVAQLRAMGFDADDDAGVTRDTYILLVPSEGFSSGNTQKAAKYGIIIVPVQDFRSNIYNYM